MLCGSRNDVGATDDYFAVLVEANARSAASQLDGVASADQNHLLLDGTGWGLLLPRSRRRSRQKSKDDGPGSIAVLEDECDRTAIADGSIELRFAQFDDRLRQHPSFVPLDLNPNAPLGLPTDHTATNSENPRLLCWNQSSDAI